MVTYYELRAAWLRPLRGVIDYVVGAMHRIVLADMRARLEVSQRLANAPDSVFRAVDRSFSSATDAHNSTHA
jgi:hypothetical protein